jgi:hypothetical protein
MLIENGVWGLEWEFLLSRSVRFMELKNKRKLTPRQHNNQHEDVEEMKRFTL